MSIRGDKVRKGILNHTPWIVNYTNNTQSKYRLFCFPYAGGGASIFSTWKDKLPKEIEVCSIQLPGRENRILEKPFNQLSLLLHELIENLVPYLDQPFSFFGHSLGALISFELTCNLREKGLPLPTSLFLSGREAPQVHKSRRVINKLPKIDLLEELRRLNGTPEDVLKNDELIELLLPVIRADFSISETYIYKQIDPLPCSISVFGGLQDNDVHYNSLVKWKEQTNKNFSMHMLPGDHFFIHSERDRLLGLISRDIEKIFNKNE